MKFRYKVMIINIVLFSISLGFAGFLMIRKNYNLAYDNYLQSAVDENNLLQASVEYEVLQVINSASNYQIYNEIYRIGELVERRMNTSETVLYIRYGDSYMYPKENISIDDSIFDNLIEGEKKYIIKSENNNKNIYVISCNKVNEKYIYVISKKDITGLFEMLNRQIIYFQIIMATVIIFASVMIYFSAKYLTKPLETLNKATEKITDGKYDVKVSIDSGDEIGELADKFNCMAAAVMEHVDELKEMIHKREQFVADFTHEIKTPMTSIIGYADTLRSINLDREEELEALNYIFSEGKRLESMSHNLLDLIYLKDNTVELANCSTNNIVKEVVRIIRPALQKKKIKLITDIKSDIILVNKNLIISALLNVMDNAKKASDENSTIYFSGEKHEDEYNFYVKDNGIGMSEEECARIYDEFFMADKSRMRKEGGAGIGMSLVAAIIKAHGGTISIESKPHAGTTVSICVKRGNKS